MESKVGSFAWIELATSDAAGAKNFYTNLFGWSADDIPMGPEMTYTMFRKNGKDVGGAYKLMRDQIEAHIPPHWMLYIQADNADASAAKAVSLGAQQIVAPSDIPNVGRFAVITDPTGAHISIFQPGQHKGMTAFQEDNALCWADLNTPDAEKASKFYSDWLGWTYEVGKDGYRHIINGKSREDMIGGIPAKMHAPPGAPAHWMAYFAVKDAGASAAKAAQLGAKTIMPAELMPDVGVIGVFADPQGAVFALYQHIAR